MEKRKMNDSTQKLAYSYVPEIQSFGGKNPFANTLFILGDEFLRENRMRIERLPEKHKAEIFIRILEASQQPQPDEENLFSVFGAITPIVSENNVSLKRGAQWIGEEQTFRLTEDFLVNNTKLQKIILTNSEMQNCAAVYDGEEEFNAFDFSACFEMEKGSFFLYFYCENMLYRVSKHGIWFSADNLDLDIYGNPEIARWFIQNGENQIPMSTEIIRYKPYEFALKAGEGLNSDDDFAMNKLDLKVSCPLHVDSDDDENITIGVEILDNTLLPRCNFTNPHFSFGMKDNLKPDLIIRNGEARETPFYPFGYPLEEKSDFFVACDEAFSKRGATVVLWFDLCFEDFYQSYELHSGIDLKAFLNIDEKHKKYAKIFKNMIPEEKKCSVNKVCFQYFNGERFVLLPESGNHEKIFCVGERSQFCFIVPNDIKICEIDGVKSYWIRVCLEETGDLYYRPCRIRCPRIENIQITYGAHFKPHGIKRKTTAETRNIPCDSVIYENRYGDRPYLYMGFDGTLNDRLIMFVNIARPYGIPASSGEWEISAENGFISVSVVDDTEKFSHTGRIIFDIPKEAKKREMDFAKENLYWLRTPIIKEITRYPKIKMIYVNAAEFSLNGDCSKGDTVVLESCDYQNLSAVTITESRKQKINENEELRIKHRILNTAQMISEADISKTLLLKIPELEDIKYSFDNKRNVLSVYLKFKGTDGEDLFNKYGSYIKSRLTETNNCDVRITRPIKSLINIRATINQNERGTARLSEELRNFLDYQNGGEKNRGWKIGELPDENTIRSFFEKNNVKVKTLVISAGIYTSDLQNNYKEYMIADLQGGFYACAAGNILFFPEDKNGTDNP